MLFSPLPNVFSTLARILISVNIFKCKMLPTFDNIKTHTNNNEMETYVKIFSNHTVIVTHIHNQDVSM